MRLLLDEDVPEPLLRLLQHLLRGHTVEHVATRGWKGKTDRSLYQDASGRFDAILTNDIRQLNDPAECRAIQRSGLHHITYELEDGLDGLALASAAICAAIRSVVVALDQAPTQRIVRIHSIARSRRRFDISNPATNPPSRYWP
jgi:PIN domain-containing protein